MYCRRTRTIGTLPTARGASLIEVLIALLVLAVGMLGMAAMQMVSMRNNTSALERSQAVFHTYSILDAMRANPTVSRAGGYNVGLDGAGGGSALASGDLTRWQQSLGSTLGAGATGAVDCAGVVCSITIQWDDSRGSSDPTAHASAYQVLTVSQL